MPEIVGSNLRLEIDEPQRPILCDTQAIVQPMEGWEHTFGNFVLNEDGLKRDGRPVALGGRALALLRALAKADGSVSRAALVEAGWPGTIVEEGNLTVQIAA